MSYQLNWIQTLEAIFWADDIILIFLAVFTHFVIPVVVYIKLHKSRQSIDTKLVVLICCLIPAISTSLELFGSGWLVKDNTLNVKTFNQSADINIPYMEVRFVDLYSEWYPRTRINATAFPFLAIGKYRLTNGVVATVFIHQKQKKVLLIYANERYYMIGHAGIEKLYCELLKLGANKK